jgi:dehydrogenase/reductase SDR family protein 12
MSRWSRLLDSGLEAAIAPSFASPGYTWRKASQHWTDPAPGCMQGQTVVLTGATSGLGRYTAQRLLQLGAQLVFVARNPAKAKQTLAELQLAVPGAQVDYVLGDMADLTAVARMADELSQRLLRLDVLIHNAGALDDVRTESPQGIETTIAAHLVGPFALTLRLQGLLAQSPAPKVLWMSSGGMYSEPLQVDALQMSPTNYDGVVAYARAKRAQVALAQEMVQRLAVPNLFVAALHPGWTDTPGVEKSLPGFYRWTKPWLRTPEQGSDTLVWLASYPQVSSLPNGAFWHDRAVRPVHKLAKTKVADTAQERAKLWGWLVKLAQQPTPPLD